MKLKHKSSGKDLDATIEELVNKDYELLKKNKGFSFDWDIEKDNEVYKIYLLSAHEEILGLISLIDEKQEQRIHINLLEIHKKHQGHSKEIDNIAGCLIAFVASAAIKRGYFGFVSLAPKTKLIDHYQNQYGFRQYGRYLGIEGEIAQYLVIKYLEDGV